MNKLLFLLFLVVTIPCNAQLHFNFSVDTSEDDVRAAIHFLDSYFSEFKGKKMPDFPQYWSPEDCKAYKRPDQMIYAIASEGVTYHLMGKPTVIYIKPGHDYIQIKTLFGTQDTTGTISTLCITNHYIAGVKDHLHFVNPITLNTRDWHTTTLRNITFIYPPYHRFDRKRADSLVTSITRLEKEWGLEPIAIRYFFADTKEELQRIRGFDYACDDGNREKPSGISDDVDNIVYCGGWGENFFHEVVHVYLNHRFPGSPLKEGLAVLYGGTLGHPLTWHIPRLSKYLEQHKEIDLGKDNFSYLDNYTNPWSTIYGTLCLLVYRKEGVAGLRRLMSHTTFNDVLSKEFATPPEKQNEFLRTTLASLAAENP